MSQTKGDLTTRMMGAAMLSVYTYEEVEADQEATVQAAMVVAIAAMCSGLRVRADANQGVATRATPSPRFETTDADQSFQ